ncbi:N-acetylmuramoyl-L-alanine amidase [Ornithinibacillus sp. JPR2-1]|uniref:N-acetylmuramoyl-L-alanine amidase family protein n=1 Tax=Ornithinibacillus sp. JPR2-1 TaxID=2094019 RepID=UPI0031DBE65D
MVKVALDAGHGMNTPGKRTPDGEREWSFNSKVVTAATKYLNEYDNVTVIRLDDPTGKTDISLTKRTNKANSESADILISYHHNANTGQWGTWTGTETYHYPGSSSGYALASKIHPAIVGAMVLRDRGIKSENFHMLRESKMPAILIEGGFMDSTIDIVKLRDSNVLDRAGRALADALAAHFGLKKKSKSKVESTSGVHVVKKGDTLWGISQKYNTTVAVLKSLNKISGDLIVPGQKLKLPSNSKKAATKPSLKVNAKVKVKKSAKKYATGENIPNWVKGKKYTIQQIKADRVLLKEIMSWVYKKDVE